MFKIFCLIWGVVIGSTIDIVMIYWVIRYIKERDWQVGFPFLQIAIWTPWLAFCICELITIFRGIV